MTAEQSLVRIDERSIPTSPGEIRAFMTARNEALRLPASLEHHRRIGVGRFFVIDNGSTDGTVDYLLAQPDVHLFTTDRSFSASKWGMEWINSLLDAFGTDHWALTVDADEHFIYPHYEEVGLTQLCAFLDRVNVGSVLALLLDMYSDKPIKDVEYRAGQSLIKACPFFDLGPYTAVTWDGFPPIQLSGGPRKRVFWRGENKPIHAPTMSKVPLVKWRRGLKYTHSTHQLSRVTLSDVVGALLHFKFLADFCDRVAVEVGRKEHFDASREYRAYQVALDEDPALSLYFAGSAQFQGSAQLVEKGVIRSSAEFDAYVAAITKRDRR
jgi:hypothetical protein